MQKTTNDTAVMMITQIEESCVAMGDKAYSFTMQSILDTRDNMLMLCIRMLQSMDSIQERFGLQSEIVQRINRDLRKILALSLQEKSEVKKTFDFIAQDQLESMTIASVLKEYYEILEGKITEIVTFIEWMISVITKLNYFLLVTSFTVCKRTFALSKHIPGVSTAGSFFFHIYTFVGHVVWRIMAIEEGISKEGDRRAIYSFEDEPLTAVLLSYQEKENHVPWNLHRRIQRMMHFQVSLKPFEATILLPPEAGTEEYFNHLELLDKSCTTDSQKYHVPVTPQSIPASPLSRKRVKTAFSNFSDDLVYQARDQLRLERATSIGNPPPVVPLFNPLDAHKDIFLSCGNHSVLKIGPGLYRTVRATTAVPWNRYIYFQMSISSVSMVKDLGMQSTTSAISACIGLSTPMMPLNTLVGTWKHSIGFYSSGHIIVGSQWHKHLSVNSEYKCGNTVGVLIYVDESTKCKSDEGEVVSVSVQFVIDGSRLAESPSEPLKSSFTFPSHASIYPTVTLYSQNTQILSRLAAPDMLLCQLEHLDLESDRDIWSLDGTIIRPGCFN